jgi:putative tricarboxylic transport membrane protein
MDRRDAISGAVWLVIGLIALIFSMQLGIGDFRNPRSGFVLFYAGILFVGSTLLMLVVSSCKGNGLVPFSVTWQGIRRRPVLIVIVASIMYLLVLETLGYLLATLGFMLILFGLREVRLRIVLVCSVTTVVGSYYVFHVFLKVPLPKGIINF